MQSPYKSNNTKRPQNDLKRPQMTSKDAKEKDKPVSKFVKSKNSSRGGNSKDVNPSNGKELIEQAFADSKMADFIEFRKKKIRRLKIKYHKPSKKNKKSYSKQSNIGQNVLVPRKSLNKH